MSYFLKSIGLSDDPLPPKWWDERPEIVDAMYFGKCPRRVLRGDTLIYYAVGGDGRLCGVAEVIAEATDDFKAPEHWTEERRGKFRWQVPVRLISRCAADDHAPRFGDFHEKR